MQNLKSIRKREGYTTETLAGKLGVVPSTITNWELGTREAKASTVRKLAEILNCTADELLGIEKTPGQSQA